MQIKINVVEKLRKLKGNVYKIDYYSDIDISNVDLSKSPIYDKNIRNSILYNTNLKLKLDNNFYTNCDLRSCIFNYDEKSKVTFNNVLFDNNQIEYLNFIYKDNIIYDYETLLKNNSLFVSSNSLLKTINGFLIKKGIDKKILNDKSSQEIVNFIELLLTRDNENNLKTFYYSIKNELNNYKIIKLFTTYTIENITIRNLSINDNMYKLLSEFNLKNINLENITFLTKTTTLFNKPESIIHNFNTLSNVSFPNITMNDYNEIEKERFSYDEPFTFKKNLYIELGRTCNANCFFCRNNCFNDTGYNLENILTNIEKIENDLDNIVIGGGEPTLKKKDLLLLLKRIKYQSKYNIFTNGTIDKKFLNTLLHDTNVKFNISRHSYSDEINANIFKINKDKILNKEDILNFSNRITLACTCFNGGIDSIENIFKYLEYADNCNVKNVLFSNLQDDASVTNSNNLNRNLEINNKLFDDCINILRAQGYEINYPIVSTGGYILYILKNETKRLNTIVFKKYISNEELLRLWPTAVKKTFDFSMSPTGNVYANWSETGEKVKILKRI